MGPAASKLSVTHNRLNNGLYLRRNGNIRVAFVVTHNSTLLASCSAIKLSKNSIHFGSIVGSPPATLSTLNFPKSATGTFTVLF